MERRGSFGNTMELGIFFSKEEEGMLLTR